MKQVKRLRKVERAIKQATLFEPKTLYEPVEKSLIIRAFTDLKTVAPRDLKLGLSYSKDPQELVNTFYGFIGEQVVKSSLSQTKPPILHVPSQPSDPQSIRFAFDIELETLKGERVDIEIKTTQSGERYQCLTINQKSWEAGLQKYGKRPDYVVAVKLNGEGIELPDSLKTLPSNFGTLTKRLQWVEIWVKNYHEQYNAEIVGWIEGRLVDCGADKGGLEHARREYPCFTKPCYWCKLNDPKIQPMNKFWAKFLEPVLKKIQGLLSYA